MTTLTKKQAELVRVVLRTLERLGSAKRAEVALEMRRIDRYAGMTHEMVVAWTGMSVGEALMALSERGLVVADPDQTWRPSALVNEIREWLRLAPGDRIGDLELRQYWAARWLAANGSLYDAPEDLRTVQLRGVMAAA